MMLIDALIFWCGNAWHSNITKPLKLEETHINTNTQHNSKKLCAPWQIVCTALLVKELRQRWPSNGQFHTEFIRPPVSLADCWTQGKYDERAPCPNNPHFRPCCHAATNINHDQMFQGRAYSGQALSTSVNHIFAWGPDANDDATMGVLSSARFFSAKATSGGSPLKLVNLRRPPGPWSERGWVFSLGHPTKEPKWHLPLTSIDQVFSQGESWWYFDDRLGTPSVNIMPWSLATGAYSPVMARHWSKIANPSRRWINANIVLIPYWSIL